MVVAYCATRLPPTSEWTVPERPPNVRILADNGALISNRGDTPAKRDASPTCRRTCREAVIAIEDRRFYCHFGIDPIGLVRALLANLRAGGVVAGRLDHHPAAGEEPVPDAGPHLRAQGPGGDARALAGDPA